MSAYGAGRIEEAERHIVQCEHAGSSDPELHFYRGLVARTRHQFSDAERSLRQAIAANPQEIRYVRELGTTLEWSNRLYAALRHYESALRRWPGDRGLELAMARVLRWTGNLDEAEELYTKGSTERTREIGVAMGWIALDRRDFEGAQRIFQEILAVDPRDAEAAAGLRQARQGRRNVVRAYGFRVAEAGGSGSSAQGIAFEHDASARWRVFADLSTVDNRSGAGVPSAIGIDDPGPYKSEQKLGATYRYSPKHIVTASLAHRSFSSTQEWIPQLEGVVRPDGWTAQLSGGLRTSIRESEGLHSTLVFAGAARPITEKVAVFGQIFLSHTKSGTNGNTVVAGVTLDPFKWLQVRASLGRSVEAGQSSNQSSLNFRVECPQGWFVGIGVLRRTSPASTRMDAFIGKAF